MRRFRDRGLQNQDFCIFVFTGSRPIQSLIGRPKNHSKIHPKRFFGGARKMDTPFLGLFKAALNGTSRCHFRRPLSKERTLAISEDARRRPKNRDTTKNWRPESDFKRKTIGFYISYEKYKKNLKTKTPVDDRPLP